MATSASSVLTAFSTGAGVSTSIVHDAIAFVLAGLALLWLAWAVKGVGERFLDNKISKTVGLFYVTRGVVVILLIVAVLTP